VKKSLVDTIEMSVSSVYTDKDDQILRLLASDVAAIAGFHPFVNECELFHKYLYQDLGNLLLVDSENLGMDVIEKKEEIDNIINLLPLADAADLKNLLKKSHRR
jgi:hypothetical protein